MKNRIFEPILALLVIFVAWESIVWIFKIPPQILPSPSTIFLTLWRGKGAIFNHTIITFQRTIIGFALGIVIGIGFGLAIGYSAAIYSGLYPIITAFYCLPKAAIIPIFILWVGLGTPPAILTSLSIAFFPILVNVATGISTIDPDLADLFRSLGGGKKQIFLKVGLRGSLPYFFASLKLAGPSALVGVVISEMIAASNGMGYVMLLAGSSFNMALMFADIFMMALIGIIIYAICTYVDRRFAWWAYR